MAEVTITKGINDLKKIFSQMNKIYFMKTPNQALTAITTFDLELPVLESGVAFKSAEAQTTKTKLTSGSLWDVTAKSGDDDISYQTASLDPLVLSTFLDATVSGVDMTSTVNGITYTGYGISTDPKKVLGSLFMTSQDLSCAIYLPNTQIFSNLVNEENKPAYINSKVSALNDLTGKNIYVLHKKV